jgi:hypothetical protein
MNYQDNGNSRFTPNNGVLPEDPIGDVMLGKDLNSFAQNRYQQQMQTQYTPNYQENTLRTGSVDNIGIAGSNYIPNGNHVISSEYNQPGNQSTVNSTEVVKVIKLRFEIDFQINLNVVNK